MVPFLQDSDEYYGVTIVDSRSEIEDLATSNLRVWIVIDHKVDQYLSDELREAIESKFHFIEAEGDILIYSNQVL